MGSLKKIFLFIFSTFLIISITYCQNCSPVKSGTYEVEYDNPFRNYPPTIYEFINDTCYITRNKVKIEYYLRKYNDCTFQLKTKDSANENTIREFKNTIEGMNNPYFEIYKVEESTYYFILKVNAHIQIYSGKFIKQTT